jgi:hypothetical protein
MLRHKRTSKMRIKISIKEEAHHLEVLCELTLQCQVHLSVSVLVPSAHIYDLGPEI